MKPNQLVFLVFLFLFVGGGIFVLVKIKNPHPKKESLTITIQEKSSTMKLSSSAFTHNQTIPAKYTCDGENVNPPLTITDVLTDSKSLTLIVDDPDAPAGTWVHWTVWNISPDTKQIAENSVPSNVIQGKTSFGNSGYGGPCPPSGTHRYFFKLYALDTTLSLGQNATKQDLEKAFVGHILDQAELIGLYSRK